MADKKDIAKLDFDISAAQAKLKSLNEDFSTIASEIEKSSKKIGENLGGNSGYKFTVNLNDSEKQLGKLEQLSTKSLEKIAEKQIRVNLEKNAEIEVANVKHENKMEELYEKQKNAQIKTNNEMAESTKSLYDRIGNYAQTYLVYQGFNALKKGIQETIDEMVQVEYKMVEIDRVLGENSLNIDKYRDNLIQLAYDYGNSFENVADITLRLSQAGYDSQEALALTEKTLLALNTAELDATQATSDMIAVMAQWGKMTGTASEQADEYGKYIDYINKVADNFPTTSSDILNALKKTSSAFNIAGASIEETIATIVAAEKASQRGGKVIGTALANITQQLKAEGKLNLAEQLGLNFFEDEAKTKFKPIMEVFQEMSDRMQKLKDEGKESSTEMQQLLEMFTVFRRNIGASLLGQMSGEDSTYQEVLKTLNDSLGYSLQENAKHMGTAKAAQEQFNATLLQLKTDVWDGGVENVYRDMLNTGTDIIKFLSSMSKEMTLLPTVIATVTAGFGLFSKKMNAEGLKKYVTNLKEMSTALKLYNKNIEQGNTTIEKYYKHLGKDVPDSMNKYTSSLNGAEASMGNFITKTVTATAKQLAFNLVVAAGEAAISFGLSLAIQGIVTVINDWIHATEKAAEALQEMNNNLAQSESDLSTYAYRFKELREEMSSGKLTQEEYNKKKIELKDIEDELIKRYGKEAEGIDLVTGSIEEQEKAIRKLGKEDYLKNIQENQDSINAMVKKFTENTTKQTRVDYGGQVYTKTTIEDINNILKQYDNVKFATEQTMFTVEGTGKKVLETYREIFNKINEYADNYTDTDNAKTEAVKNNANTVLKIISNQINELEKEYGDDYNTYQEYLENKLKYDNYYLETYEKILAARAKLSKAIASGNEKEIEDAQKEVSKVYTDAIKLASKDKTTSEGMKQLLQEQIDNLNKEIDSEKYKIKLKTVINEESGETLKDQIQTIISDMGDIQQEDLFNMLLGDPSEYTPKVQELKDRLDDAGISVDDFKTLFEALGFTFGEVDNQTEQATYTLGALDEQVNNSFEHLSSLEQGFVSVYNAMNEFNSQGYISASTLQNLIQNDLIQYLTVVNGKLAVNEAAMANASTAALADAKATLAAQAANDILAIALGNASGAAESAEGSASSLAGQGSTLAAALLKAGNAGFDGAQGIEAFWDALRGEGVDVDGITSEAKAAMQGVLDSFKSAMTVLNNMDVQAVSYERVYAQGSGGGGGGGGGGSSSSAAESAAAREAEQAAKEAQKAEEEAYKNRLNAFTDYIKEKERKEQRWVKVQQDLGALTTKDYLYVLQQRTNRYKQYLDNVKKATWMNAEDRAKLEKEYTEKIEDLNAEYLSTLKKQLNERTKALQESNKKEIQSIKDKAQAEIDALKKVDSENTRIRKKEDYEKQRGEILNEIEYWSQGVSWEAQKNLAAAKKKLAELDEDWKQTLEDWNTDDKIAKIEEDRDKQIAAIEEAETNQIAAWKKVYDERVKAYSESDKIIFDESKIHSKALYNTYKKNFIDPLNKDLKNMNKVNGTAPAKSNSSSNKNTNSQPYETYTVKSGDSLSSIARGFYGDASMWPAIYEDNKDVIGSNPNLIFAGQVYKIPKFHEGGIVGGNKEGYALLKPQEVVLKPEWAEGLNKMVRMINSNDKFSLSQGNNTTIEVKGDMVKISANISNKNDADYLTRKIEKTLKEKFNIKK